MKNFISKWIKELGVVTIIGAILISINFYTNLLVTDAVAKKTDEMHTQQIIDNKFIISSVQKDSKLLSIQQDSMESKNTREHQVLKDGIKNIQQDINTLKFIILTSNKALRNDLETSGLIVSE